jgi:hypothetical protein
MTYEYKINDLGVAQMYIVLDDDSIISMFLDPRKPINIEEHEYWDEHRQIIEALGNDEKKALKYAEYLASGGCNRFDLTEILTTINS